MRALLVVLVAVAAVLALVGFGSETPAPAAAQESVAVPTTVLEWTTPTLTAVDSLTRLIVRANPQIRNPRRIQIGDPVRVPTAHGDTVYTAEPWMLRRSGAKGCFWLIAEAHLTRKAFAEAKVVPITPIPTAVVDTTTTAPSTPTANRYVWWASLLVVVGGAVLVLVAIAIYYLLRRRRDPYAVPPVVTIGLGGSNDYVLAQIRRASETFPAYHSDLNRRISNPVRGQVISRTGEKHFTARVGQRDGTFSRRNIPHGTPSVRITVQSHNGEGQEVEFFEYWLSHCGNPVAEVGRDRFELPAGWEFVPYTVQTPPRRATTSEPAVTTAAEPAPTTSAEPAAPAQPTTASSDGQPMEYTVDLTVTRTDKGLTVKGTSSRYVSRIHAGEYEIEF